MAVTFLLKERNVFGRPAGGGGQPRALGQVVGSCPTLTISPRDSSMRLALGCWEPAGHPALSEGSPPVPTSPFLLHTSLCHTAAWPGLGGDPCLASAACPGLWERSCQVGAVGLTPVGGELSQETEAAESCFFLSNVGHKAVFCPNDCRRGLQAPSGRGLLKYLDAQEPWPNGQGSNAVPGRTQHLRSQAGMSCLCQLPHPLPFCQVPAGVELWQLCLVSPFLADLRDGMQVGGRAKGDITSNGPKCGNSVNKVYFTFNFGI